MLNYVSEFSMPFPHCMMVMMMTMMRWMQTIHNLLNSVLNFGQFHSTGRRILKCAKDIHFSVLRCHMNSNVELNIYKFFTLAQKRHFMWLHLCSLHWRIHCRNWMDSTKMIVIVCVKLKITSLAISKDLHKLLHKLSRLFG